MSGRITALSSSSSSSSEATRRAQGADRQQRRVAHRVVGTGPQRRRLGGQPGHRQPLEPAADLVIGTDDEWRSWLNVAIRSDAADRQATCSTRIASTSPSRLFGRPNAWPDNAARAAATASTGSDLPSRRRTCRFGRSTSTTAIPARSKWRASPAPYEPVPSTPTRSSRRGSAASRPVAGSPPRWCRTLRCRAPRQRDRPRRPRARRRGCRHPRSPNMSSLRWSSPSLPVATGSRVGTHLPGGCREPGLLAQTRTRSPPDR